MSDDSAETTQWLFQFNPDWYDLEASVKRSLVEEWTMSHARDRVRVGQRIHFLRAGGAAGGQYGAVVATGRIASLVFEKPDETDEHLRNWVQVVYDAMIVPPLTRPEMLQDAMLRTYLPLAKGIMGANFRPPPDVAARIEALVHGRLRPIGTSDVTVDKRIFVSHSHEDSQFCHQLVGDLRQALGGHKDAVWLDESGGLHGGDNWWRDICDSIKERPVFIVVVSPDSMISNWVHDEINLAWMYKNNAPGGKTIMPLMYRPTTMHDFLSLQQAISFVAPRPYEEALRDLLVALNLAK